MYRLGSLARLTDDPEVAGWTSAGVTVSFFPHPNLPPGGRNGLLHWVDNMLSWRFGHKIFSMVILSLPLIQEGQLSEIPEYNCNIKVLCRLF